MARRRPASGERGYCGRLSAEEACWRPPQLGLRQCPVAGCVDASVRPVLATIGSGRRFADRALHQREHQAGAVAPSSRLMPRKLSPSVSSVCRSPWRAATAGASRTGWRSSVTPSWAPAGCCSPGPFWLDIHPQCDHPQGLHLDGGGAREPGSQEASGECVHPLAAISAHTRVRWSLPMHLTSRTQSVCTQRHVASSPHGSLPP